MKVIFMKGWVALFKRKHIIKMKEQVSQKMTSFNKQGAQGFIAGDPQKKVAAK